MAAVEVPQTTSHLGMSKHDRYSKNPAESVNASGDGHDNAQFLTDQNGFSPLSQKENFGGQTDKSHQKVTEILNKVLQLSNTEKLLLYLKLPTGNSEVPLKINPNYPLGNRTHVTQAFTWIRTHLDEDNEVSLQKDEVYHSYKAYCSLHSIKVLSQADFGKAIKQVFPNVKPRRLGMQNENVFSGLNWTSKGIPINGDRLTNLRFADDVVLFSESPQELQLMVEELRTASSEYCYSGLCKRKQVPVPTFPDLEELKTSNIYVCSYYFSFKMHPLV
ncbi:DNA-binding protein Rfx5 [Nymphon striatum]|nr:DNA-binding protein Rfx5 [Nymphon striatum]